MSHSHKFVPAILNKEECDLRNVTIDIPCRIECEKNTWDKEKVVIMEDGMQFFAFQTSYGKVYHFILTSDGFFRIREFESERSEKIFMRHAICMSTFQDSILESILRKLK